jgi:hypothetical protein
MSRWPHWHQPRCWTYWLPPLPCCRSVVWLVGASVVGLVGLVGHVGLVGSVRRVGELGARLTRTLTLIGLERRNVADHELAIRVHHRISEALARLELRVVVVVPALQHPANVFGAAQTLSN